MDLDKIRKEIRQGLELRKTNGYTAVSSSLIDKEALISTLYKNIIHKRLVYGTMQTEYEVNTYIDGFFDCMNAIKKH